jgi:hypothetical protein
MFEDCIFNPISQKFLTFISRLYYKNDFSFALKQYWGKVESHSELNSAISTSSARNKFIVALKIKILK